MRRRAALNLWKLNMWKKVHVQVLVAMVAGVTIGLIFGRAGADAVGWMGDLFMRLLKMVIVPLVSLSVASGIASLGTGRELGRIGGKTLAFYLVSGITAMLVGQVLYACEVGVLDPA